MSKSLRSFPEEARTAIARRRAGTKTLGNAYWGARDYLIAKGEIPAENRLPVQEKPTEEIMRDVETKRGLAHERTKPAKRNAPGFRGGAIPQASASVLQHVRKQLIAR